MTRLSIIGTGSMGSVIAEIATRGGHAVQSLGSADHDRPVTGEVVVLAVPHPAVAEVIERRGEQLAGRVVVDVTNPVAHPAFDRLTVPGESSAAAEIAAALPSSRVLKAFNTTFAGHLATGRVGDRPTTVLVAGDDAEAKAQLAGIVTDGGLRAVDAGGLDRARELEALGFLQMSLGATERIAWTGGFALV